eukprot:TRINITY_DN8904_c0_g1_i1.p1 TRINITY_DN8904_c0_g1~~TRINITY_DN8904_c0_g1_i1.p1  ORF type:complete len:165 (-),score=12.45 TRINITY_DN8904_c0_g1_i1:93-587(-)
MEAISTFFSSGEASLDNVKNFFQPAPSTPASPLTLSLKKRVIAFAVCLVLGVAFCFLSTLFFFNPRMFAKFYTFGNICLLGSTMFLVGPWKQIKNMFTPNRMMSTMIYLLAMLMTLYTALVLQSKLLAIPMIIVQIGAAFWYGVSYIPYGQEMARASASFCFNV